MSGARQFTWQGNGVEVGTVGVQDIHGVTCGKKHSKGSACVYSVCGKDGWKLEVADVQWQTGERDVRTLQYSAHTPSRLHRLAHGLRLLVEPHSREHLWVALRQARLKPDVSVEWSNLYQATMEELSKGSGLQVRAALEALGAEVGLRGQLMADKGRDREHLCVLFPTTRQHLPIVCYTITRVLPVWNKYTG